MLMVNAHSLDTSSHSLKVHSLAVKESSDSRINSQLPPSAQLPCTLTRVHVRPTGQLTASSHSFTLHSCWRAARRNKLETKENRGHPSWLQRQPWLWVPGRRASRNRGTDPDSLSYSSGTCQGRDRALIPQAQRRDTVWPRGPCNAVFLRYDEVNLGTGCKAEVSFLPGAMGFKVKSS